MAPATIKRTLVIKQSARHFCPIATKFGVTQQIFIKSPVSNFMEICFLGSCGDSCRQTDGNEANTRFSRLYGRVYKWRSAKEMFSHACVSLLNFSWNLLPVNRTAILCADTHSSLPLGQTPVNATRATPAKRVRSSTSSPDDLHILRRYKTSEHRCAHNIVRSMARSLWIECSQHQKFRKNRWPDR